MPYQPRSFLQPVAWLYGQGIKWRNRRFDEGKKALYNAPFPVVSVGNIHTGGAGKTPMAEYLLAWALSQGLKPAYLSRGYGRMSKGPLRVLASDPKAYGDEASQVFARFPEAAVVVAEKRAQGLSLLSRDASPDLAILDDAFQHRHVHRDLDLVVLDGSKPIKNARLLPAGWFRELPSALHRADFLVVNKWNTPEAAAEWEQALAPFGKPMAFVQPVWKNLTSVDGGDPIPVDELAGAPVFACSGIANPEFFHRQITLYGGRLLDQGIFPDHHAYTQADLQQLAQRISGWRKKHPDVRVVTTEKDSFRLLASPGYIAGQLGQVYFPRLEFVWVKGENELRRCLQSLI